MNRKIMRILICFILFFGFVNFNQNLTLGAPFDSFTDQWNLDAAEDGRPIGELTVSIATSNNLTAGTNDPVYFGMELLDGKRYERILDKSGYDEFDVGSNDDYYLYVGDQAFEPAKIRKIWLRKSGTDDWKVGYLAIRINGKVVYSKTLEEWLKGNPSEWQINVDGL